MPPFTSISRLVLSLLILMLAVNGQAQTLGYSWGRQYAHPIGGGSVRFTCSTTDAQGRIYAAGYFDGTHDFDPGPGAAMRTALVGTDVFVTVMDSNGLLMLAAVLPEADSVYLRDMAVDGLGNIWLAGQFENTLDADPGAGVVTLSAPPSVPEGFLLKLDPAGNHLWSGSLEDGFGGEVDPLTIATDEANNVFVAGSFVGTATDLDPGAGASPVFSGTNMGFLFKLTQSGTYVWGQQSTTASTGLALPIDLQVAGGIIHSLGQFRLQVDFCPGAPDSTLFYSGGPASNLDVYLHSCDTAGNYLWSRSFGGTSTENPAGLCIAPVSGDVLVSGKFAGFSCDFNPSPSASLTLNAGLGNQFLLRLNSAGGFDWVRQFGGASDLQKGLAVDSSGSAIVTGVYYGTADFDPGAGLHALTPLGFEDTYLLKLDALGQFIWAYGSGGAGSDVTEGISLDRQGNLFQIGDFSAGSDLDPTSGVDPGGADAFAFVRRLSQGDCAAFTAHFPHATDPTCDTVGFAVVTGLDATGPCTYLWSTGATDDTASIASTGLYTVVATDSVGCTDTSTILMGGPPAPPSYDFEPFAFSYLLRVPAPSNFTVAAMNHACLPEAGELQVILPFGMTFTSSVPPASAVVGDTVKFSFMGLEYANSPFLFDLVLLDTVHAMGDSVCFGLRMMPLLGDAVPLNNFKAICDTVGAAYDPNDKQVYPAGICEEHFTEKSSDLQYTIRFQNTGTAPAVDVYILDTLDADLDPSSLVLKHTSHDCIAELLPGNVLKFRFDGINLPDSSTDFDGSQGHVIFEASPDAGLPDNTLIENRVGIYFDLNPVVLTNTVFNTMMDSLPLCGPLAVPAMAPANAFTLFPNPAHSSVTLHASHPWSQAQLTVLNLHGQTMSNATLPAGNEHSIDLQGLSSGIYFVRISTPQGTETLRLLVE